MPGLNNDGYLIDTGRIPGTENQTQTGLNPSIGAAMEDIWNVGGLFPWQTGPVDFELVSTLAGDSAAGAGAQSVFIGGLDDAGEAASETVITNGLTPVALSRQYTFIDIAFADDVGSNETNLGIIDVRAVVSGDVQARIEPGDGQNSAAVATVPSNRTAYFFLWTFSGANGGSAAIFQAQLMIRRPGKAWRVIGNISAESRGASGREFDDVGGLLESGTQVRVRAFANKAATIVNSSFAVRIIEPRL